MHRCVNMSLRSSGKCFGFSSGHLIWLPCGTLAILAVRCGQSYRSDASRNATFIAVSRSTSEAVCQRQGTFK